MARFHAGLPSFAGGELAKNMYGRIDISKYMMGAALLSNWFVLPQGGVSTRAGMGFVGPLIDQNTRSRFFPFQFRTAPSGQNYILEFGHMKMRVIMNGGYVLDTDTAISAIAQASNGVVTSNAHGLSTGDNVYIEDIEGMKQLNQRFVTVTVLDVNTFLIDVNTSGFDAYVSGGRVKRRFTLVTPYTSSDLALLKTVQSQDTMTITHPSYAPRRLTRTGHSTWSLTTATFAPGVAAPANPVSNAAGTAYYYVVTAIDDNTGEESLQSAEVGSSTQTSKITWDAVAGCTKYNIYKKKNGIFGFIGNATIDGFTDTTVVPDTFDTPPKQNNLFSGTDNYPGSSTFHDGRQWYARSNSGPQTFWASQSANINSLATSEPVRDSDAITRTIASREVNEIRHLVSFNQLLIFTSGAEFKVSAGGNDDVITPAFCVPRVQGYTGSNEMPPITTRNSILFAGPSSRKVLDVEYSFSTDKWDSRDVSILSEHLFRKPLYIEEWAYCKDPYSIVWVVRNDGALLGFTYLREHDVYAWTQHHTDGVIETVASIQEDNETVLYLGVKRTINGQTVRYAERMYSREWNSANEARAVDCGLVYNGWNTDESKTLRLEGGTDYFTGETATLIAVGHTPFTADSVGKYYILRNGQNQVNLTVTSYNSSSEVEVTLDFSANVENLVEVDIHDWALGIRTLSGLWHIENEIPAVLADGSVIETSPPTSVQNGEYILERTAGEVVIGLPYVCDMRTLPLETPGPENIQGILKVMSTMAIKLEYSRDLKVGPTFEEDMLSDIKLREDENWGQATELFTGLITELPQGYWSEEGQMCIRQDKPLPATILGIYPDVELGDE